jgi:hypothetical protein
MWMECSQMSNADPLARVINGPHLKTYMSGAGCRGLSVRCTSSQDMDTMHGIGEIKQHFALCRGNSILVEATHQLPEMTFSSSP